MFLNGHGTILWGAYAKIAKVLLVIPVIGEDANDILGAGNRNAQCLVICEALLHSEELSQVHQLSNALLRILGDENLIHNGPNWSQMVVHLNKGFLHRLNIF